MKTLAELAEEVQDVVRPFGHAETLLFYGLVAPKLKKFLAGKEIAAKNWLPSGPMPYLIKRGSKEEPLGAEEMAREITPEFLEIRRTTEHLADAKSKLTRAQQKIWNYFLPRKLADFFYATNGEGEGKPIERIFFDLDRGERITSEQARAVADAFVEVIDDDVEFKVQLGKILESEKLVAWTGSSFHVFLFFKKPQPAQIYEKYFQYTKKDPGASFTGRWAAQVAKKVGFKVVGGHEKKPDEINIDPSQTPSGKLCRAPLGSLHMADARTVDGVSLPLERKMLGERGLVEELHAYTPKKLIEEIDSLAKRLPEKFR
ncbi:MAG: hypothetical protein AB1468_06555 [Candidatus Micrarchaeota archaeon]